MILEPNAPSRHLRMKDLRARRPPPPARPMPDNLKPRRWKHGQSMRAVLPGQQDLTMSVPSGAINQRTRR